MRTLVVYESMFGNTREVAQAVASGLARCGEVRLVEVGDAPRAFDGIELLVVGGPTHAFGMSRSSTRQEAAGQADGPLVSSSRGIREWIATLPPAVPTALAIFDTKVRKARRLPGAARAAGKAMRSRGFREVTPAESFLVEGTPGPLVDGELDRAFRWGESLGGHLVSAGSR